MHPPVHTHMHCIALINSKYTNTQYYYQWYPHNFTSFHTHTSHTLEHHDMHTHTHSTHFITIALDHVYLTDSTAGNITRHNTVHTIYYLSLSDSQLGILLSVEG